MAINALLSKIVVDANGVSSKNISGGKVNEFDNRESVRVYLDGWMRGDAAMIISRADRKRFTCSWGSTGDIYNFDQFPAFFNQLKVDAEQVGSNSDSMA